MTEPLTHTHARARTHTHTHTHTRRQTDLKFQKYYGNQVYQDEKGKIYI